MRKSLWLFLIAALALSALATVPRASSASDQPAPQVLETVPDRGQELLVDGTLTLLFDQPMDRVSTEGAFTSEPSIKGSFSWPDESTLVFKPAVNLNRATSFKFTLSEKARSKEGVPLKGPFNITLRTVGELNIVQTIPTDGTTDIEANPTLTVIFNRPVVPLVSIEEMKNLKNPLVIDPPAEGAGEWLSTSIYTYKPKQLVGGTKYTVTVKAGLTDVTGSALAQDASFSFTTISPRAIEVRPEDSSTRVRLDQPIVVTFSQPMNTESVEKALRITAGTARAQGTITWNDDKNQMTFKPSPRFEYGTTYTISIAGSDVLSATGAHLKEDLASSFTTHGLPTLNATYPENLSEENQRSGFQLMFDAPMNFKDFKGRVTIDPKPGLTFDDQMDDSNFYYIVGFSHEPSTSYTITLDTTGLVDLYGTPFKVEPDSKVYSVVGDNKLQIKFTTAQYPSEVSLRTGGNRIGLYSAYNALTKVYTTHRNLDTINLSLSSVSQLEFLRLLSQPWDQLQPDQIQLLRSWSIKVENPKNVLRYDLLTVSDQGLSTPPVGIDCPGAPPSRIQVGMNVIVLPDDPTPINVRETPSRKGRVLKQLPANTELAIRGGPTCVDSIVWWQIDLGKGSFGWVAEGAENQYFIGVRGASGKVTTQVQPTPGPAYRADDKPLKPGLYVLKYNTPALPATGSDIYTQHIMLVATANLTLKVTERNVLAWVTDLKSGQPVPNAALNLFIGVQKKTPDSSIYSIEPLGKTTSDASGIANFTMPARLNSLYTNIYAVLDDGTNYGVGFSGMDNGISPWEFNQYSNYYPQDVNIYLYSDRILYRPGQPVYFRGVLRDKNDMVYSISGIKQVPVTVTDPTGAKIWEKLVDVTPYGTFSGQFDIASAAQLGYYQIVARINRGDNADADNERVFSHGFNVAQYRVPEYQVSAAAETTEVLQGDKIRVTVNSSYFFGGAVSNAKVEWNAYANDFYFNYSGDGAYSFTDFNEDEGYRDNGGSSYRGAVSNGTGTTDAQGRFTIELNADLGKAKSSQTFTVEALVTDESGQQIAAQASVIVHQGQFYIGAGPEEYIGTAGQAQKINLITVKWNSAPQPNTDLSVRVVERVWSSVQEVDPENGGTNWKFDVKETDVASGVARTGADGKGTYEFTPSHGGIYKVYVTSRDSKGNQITSSSFVWIAGPDYVPWRQQNSNRIDLKIDRTDFKVGDTASILIASPFQGEAKALVTVERGSILKTEVITMTTNSTVYKLPITPDLAPDAYVSVVVVKGVDAKNPVAAFRMGLIQLNVDTERFKLNVALTPDKAQAGPRDTVNYKVKVTDYQNKPVQAEVGLSLTDLAVISLMPDTGLTMLDTFYSRAGLGVRTGVSLTQSVDQATQEILTTIKGGGGGGGDGGIFTVRQQFVDTPFWKADVTTDAQGEATVTVTLPDNLTTWRMDARAVTLPMGDTNSTLVGQITTDIIATKPLLVRPVTPRFYIVGDQGTLAAVVNNNTGQDQDVDVSIDLKGATLKSPAALKGKIPSSGRQRFEWQIEVGVTDKVDVTFFAATADKKFTDAAKSAVGQGQDKVLPVSRYEAPETVGTAGTIDAAGGTQVEGISLPRTFDVKAGNLAIRLDRSLAATTIDALTVLRNSDSNTTEAIVSRFLPNLATYGALKKLSVQNDKMKADLQSALDTALQQLYFVQKVDGGWGWSGIDTSNPLVTSWVLIGLAEAKTQGFSVRDSVVNSAVKYLQDYASKNAPKQQAPTWQLNSQAFMLYALAQVNAPIFSRAVSLFGIREKMGLYARAYLAMTFNRIDPKNTRYTDALLSDLVNHAATSSTGTSWQEDNPDYFNWNTNTRTTAIILKALVQLQPTSPLIPNVVRWLMIARKADSWETSQETAWAVMALSDYMQTTGELKPNYSFGVRLNANQLTKDVAANPTNVEESVNLRVEVSDLLKGQLNKLYIDRTSGDGMLYYTAHLTAYLPVEEIKAVSRGITISRQYSLASDRTNQPITEAKVGDNIQVTLTIVLPTDMNYVQITDPIPAGAELVDRQLATSAIGEAPNLQLDDPLASGWGWWWFSDTQLRDDRVVMTATYLPAGTYRYTYTLRAGLAGVYHVIPATGQQVYFPEVYGRSDGMLFTLKAADPGTDPTDVTPTPTPKK